MPSFKASPPIDWLRRYLDRNPFQDDGRKSHLYKCARFAFNNHVPEQQAVAELQSRCTGFSDVPDAQIPDYVARQVTRAYGSGIRAASAPVASKVPTFDPDELSRRAAEVDVEITNDWLAEQSPECVL